MADEMPTTSDQQQLSVEELDQLLELYNDTNDPREKNKLLEKIVNAYLNVYAYGVDDISAMEQLPDEIVDNTNLPPETLDQISDYLLARTIGKASPSNDPSQQSIHKNADPLMMFNGQFIHKNTDLRINGAGIDFVFHRTYANQTPYHGPLGFNWDHNYNLWLRVSENIVYRSSGELREDAYVKHPKFGQVEFTYWVPPPGQHGVIIAAGASFEWHSPNGNRFMYQTDPAHPFIHSISRIEDRFGNYLSFAYQNALLYEVEINNPNRKVLFHYDSKRRITAIQDYVGRIWRYAYDDFGDLIATTTPATDRYTEGLTTCYEYSSAQAAGNLQHNLTQITDPAGQRYLENMYGTEQGLLRYNRVTSQRWGGGEAFFEYEDVIQDFEFDYSDAERPAHKTTLVNRNGHVVTHFYNKFGNLIVKEEKVTQEEVPTLLRDRYRYNEDGDLVGTISPEGRIRQYLYGRDYFQRRHQISPEEVDGHDQLTQNERMGFGNLLAIVKRADFYDFNSLNLSRGVWGDFFPDIFSISNSEDIVKKFTYKKEFQLLSTSSDTRYTERSDPAFQESQRYVKTLTKCDYEGANFLLRRVILPDATVPDGTVSVNISRNFPDYDARGRILRSIDEMGVETLSTYYDSTDGELEGYQKDSVIDPKHANNPNGLNIKTGFTVNKVGIPLSVKRPKAFSPNTPLGQFETFNEVNELDQVIKTTLPRPFLFETKMFYSENGLLDRTETDLKDDAGNPILDGKIVTNKKYNDQHKPVEESVGGPDVNLHRRTYHTYNESDLPKAVILPRGNSVKTSYDERLLQTEVIRGFCTPNESITKFRYDGDGLKVKSIDPNGNITRYKYDAFARLIATVDPQGNITRMDYDNADNIVRVFFFEKVGNNSYLLLSRAESFYDEYNRKIVESSNLFETPPSTHSPYTSFVNLPGPGTIAQRKYFYDRKGRLEKFINPKGQIVTIEYDALDRKIKQTDALRNYTTYTYDEHDNIIRRDLHEQIRNPATGTLIKEEVFSTINTYDELDRLTSSMDSMGNVTRFFYDSLGRLIKTIDPLGNQARFQYDIFGSKIANIKERTGNGLGTGNALSPVSSRYAYDDNGNLAVSVDPKGNRTEYEFDDLDRTVLTRYPDGTTEEVHYDPNDNITEYRDGNGLLKTYKYDTLNRLVKMDIDKSALLPGLTIEGATFGQYEYDGKGRVLKEENDFSTITQKFDSLNDVIEESCRYDIPGASTLGTKIIKRSYDLLGNLLEIHYPSGRMIKYHLDSLNRISKIENLTKGQNYPGSNTFPDTYDILQNEHQGLRRGMSRYGNKTATSFSYDKNGRVIQIKHKDQNNAQILTGQYLYDGAGNMRIRQDFNQTGDILERFKFNSLYWLTKHELTAATVQFDPSALAPNEVVLPATQLDSQSQVDAITGNLAMNPGEFTYRYDEAGNRTEERRLNQPQKNFSSNNLNQYTQIEANSYTYDKNGNLISDGSHKFYYNYNNQLARVLDLATNQGLAQFFYDTRGRRISKVTANDTMYRFFNKDGVIEEYLGSVIQAQYVHHYAIDSHSQICTQQKEYWYHKDLVGSTRLLTDQSANVAGQYRYDPLGNSIVDSGPYNPHKYMGRTHDQETQLYDFRMRTYNPATGRFLQRDTLPSNNLYLFVDNNPLSSVDPDGREPRQTSAGDEEPPTWALSLHAKANGFIDEHIALQVEPADIDPYDTVAGYQLITTALGKGFTEILTLGTGTSEAVDRVTKEDTDPYDYAIAGSLVLKEGTDVLLAVLGGIAGYRAVSSSLERGLAKPREVRWGKASDKAMTFEEFKKGKIPLPVNSPAEIARRTKLVKKWAKEAGLDPDIVRYSDEFTASSGGGATFEKQIVIDRLAFQHHDKFTKIEQMLARKIAEDEKARAIFAHEVGHYKLRHSVRYTRRGLEIPVHGERAASEVSAKLFPDVKDILKADSKLRSWHAKPME